MIEIIPRPGVKAPPWQKYLFYFSVALLTGIILSFFILGFLWKKSSLLLEDLRVEIVEGRTPENLALEREIRSWERQIKTFSRLSERHYQASKFFEELEKLTHPRVRYSALSLDTRGKRAIVSGISDSFYSLGQQLLIFNANPKILTVDSSEIAIGRRGGIEFTLELSLSPEIFK